VYSKSKIHGVYTNKDIAEDVLYSLTQKGGYNDGGVPKRFYYIDTIELDKIPERLKLI
jgi:hypothetical protein